ncbi:putative OB-fold protein [Neobacillus sp. B4I6]|jgi:uncharacterized protein|uniref:Zn-ribbon domain-containing OB-fold protein n=1 Tax=Neobacillus sp. B4I6 TaxID=3373925 RepID=UPI003D1997DC
MMENLKIMEEKWDITYQHSLGETAAHFYQTIIDQEKILGRKCDCCNRVLVAPRAYCDRCFENTSDWVEVGLEGTVEMYTVVYQGFKGLPAPPYCIAYVTLDGADTAILNYIKGIEWTTDNVAQNIKVGDRVKVKFSDRKEGRITDFWFEKVNG